MEALANQRKRDTQAGERLDYQALAPAAAALCYPFLLRAFHDLIGPPSPPPAIVGASLALALAFGVPFLGIAIALRPGASARARRLAYASVTAPTLYVLLGVIQALLRSPVPDEVLWSAIWLGLAVWPQSSPGSVAEDAPSVGRWRVIHGLTAAVLVVYVLFHIANHLSGLVGSDAHAAVMKVGRTVYRSRVGEAMLVGAMLFQIGTGLFLAWRWSAAPQPFDRTFQVASGAYLSLFILGHMNSVLIYARRFLGIPTDWNFAIGAPSGLIHDAWNIRLLPHYALGVFFVLSHIASGARVVLISHGADRRYVDRLWYTAVALSALVAAAIIAGMCGIRISAPAAEP